jgi:hypothetical protein
MLVFVYMLQEITEQWHMEWLLDWFKWIATQAIPFLIHADIEIYNIITFQWLWQ